MPKFAGARSRVFSGCCPDMMARIVGTVSVICCRVPVGDTVGAAAISGARPVLSLVGMLLVCLRSLTLELCSLAAWLAPAPLEPGQALSPRLLEPGQAQPGQSGLSCPPPPHTMSVRF